MLIGQVMEKTPAVMAKDNMANRLADKIRTSWLEHKDAGYREWEDVFYEDPEGVRFLKTESFPYLAGIDYIFKWWDHEDSHGLAGMLEVLWKVYKDENMDIYKTTIRFGERDFLEGLKSEEEQREEMRFKFRKAFDIWHELYMEVIEEGA